MSFIKDKYICQYCGTKENYYWLLPDGIIGRFPDGAEFIAANTNSLGNCYEVSVRCRNCNMGTVFYYSREGKRIESRG